MVEAVRIGLAGWSEATSRFRALYPLPPEMPKPSGLQRYAHTLDFVEINASFYRNMRRSTYERWAQDTPPHFGFSVKMHRGFTHFHRLKDTTALPAFIEAASGLGEKWQALLVQLPPSLQFDAESASQFFADVRRQYAGSIACEPRHDSWMTPDAAALLARFVVGLVRVDIPQADDTVGPGPVYVRLHGSPRRYFSAYTSDQLRSLSSWLQDLPGRARYVIFDNTGSTAATRNALELHSLLEG